MTYSSMSGAESRLGDNMTLHGDPFNEVMELFSQERNIDEEETNLKETWKDRLVKRMTKRPWEEKGTS